MTFKFTPVFIVFITGLFLPAGLSWGGGPLFLSPSGEPAKWDNSSTISYNPESGTCAAFTNAEMLAKIETNISVWTAISGIVLSFEAVPGAIGDVDSSNYTDVYSAGTSDAASLDDFNPVIFDDDGEIVSALFGAANRVSVLGFAGADSFSSDQTEILDGEALFNCFCLADNPNDDDGTCAAADVVFTEDDLDFTMIHEFGHMIGLDHTQVNESLADSCDPDVANDCNALPTMFPVSADPADQMTPSRDDEIALLALYGNGVWGGSYCTITGSLNDTDGNELRCADVQAITDDPEDTIALVSGAYASTDDLDGDGITDGAGECLSDCGAFVLRGIDPSKNYTIMVEPVDPFWVGGSGINPCVNGQPEGVVEEVIGTSADCTAGGSVDLGTIQTISSGTGSSGSTGTAVDCGEGQNFDACPPIIGGCSLRR